MPNERKQFDWVGKDFELAKDVAIQCTRIMERYVKGEPVSIIGELRKYLVNQHNLKLRPGQLRGLVHVGKDYQGPIYRLGLDPRQIAWSGEDVAMDDALRKLEKIRNDMKAATSVPSGDQRPIPSDESVRDMARDSLERRTDEAFQVMKQALDEKGQVILYGPPGTGKTYLALQYAEECYEDDDVLRVQFHPSYSYEDFIQGIRPNPKTNQFSFDVYSGPFLNLVEHAKSNPQRKMLVLIDEINRCDLPRVLGELLLMLEYRNSKMQLLYSDSKISIPSNIQILGTMNSADRSTAIVDLALRRRFRFIRFDPDFEILGDWLESNGVDSNLSEKIKLILEELNRSIIKEFGKNLAIGHSFFMKEDLDIDSAFRIWRYEIFPTLEELCLHDPDRLKKILANNPLHEKIDGSVDIKISIDSFKQFISE